MCYSMLNDRKKALLGHIIEEHIQTAQPIGSSLIAEKRMKDISAPLVRNEMQELEKEGLVTQPHTSAGRIPTEAGYRFYIENLLPVQELSRKKQEALVQATQTSHDYEENIKQLAKKVSEFSGEAVVVGFNPHNVYYTGLSNIFKKPEFTRHDLIISLSQVIDHLDEVMSKIHKNLDSDISVFLGQDNPFGYECGSVLSSCNFNGQTGIIGILGPMRMDYAENIAYLKFIKKLLER